MCARIAQKFLLNANDFLLNTNRTDGADGTNKEKGGKGAKRERGSARRRDGVEKGRKNERRAKLTKWGGNVLCINVRARGEERN